MAALLVAIAVMGVLLSAAMPVWKQTAQREKESELVFRGNQYARAIALFQRRAGPGALPPNLDILVQQRFLRKKYKDPITGEDFQLLLAGQGVPGMTGPGGAPGDGGRGGPGGQRGGPGGGSGGQQGGFTPPTFGAQPGTGPGAVAGAVGGIQGVVSKSKAKSLRLFNGRQSYNEWSFVYVPQQQAGGAAGPGGAGGPGGPGGVGGGRGGQPGPFGSPPGGGGGGPFGSGGRGGGGAGPGTFPGGPGGAQPPPPFGGQRGAGPPTTPPGGGRRP